MNDGSQQVLDQLAKSLKSLQAYNTDLRSNHFQNLRNLHPRVFLMECKYKLTQLLLWGHDLILC